MADNPSVEANTLHQRLVDQLIGDGVITSAAVESAFRAVPRHPFVPNQPLEVVYTDAPIVTKRRDDGVPISSSSQPAAMAIMLEQLEVQRGNRILEIGAGTGYNAALLAHLAGPDGHVTSIDIDSDLVDAARSHLAAATIHDCAPVEIVQADGGYGWPNAAPYDRLILTVGAWDIVPAWIDQLAANGRILVPLWLRGAQRTVAFVREGDHLESRSVTSCAFMRLRGAFAGPEGFVTISAGEEVIIVTTDDQTGLDPQSITSALAEPGEELQTGIVLDGGRAAWSGLGLWIALRDERFCSLSAEQPTTTMPSIAAEFQWTAGLMSAASLALLTPSNEPDETGQLALGVRRYGRDSSLATALFDHVTAWDAADRPGDDSLLIEVYSITAADIAPPGSTIVPRRWPQFVITWE